MSASVAVLPAVQGHEDLRTALARAADAGALHGSLLLHGPPGVGKQRLALWLAQRLLCAAPGGDDPCGACRACTLAGRLEHPDIHWFFPIERPRVSGGPDRLIEAVEDARAEILDARREAPLTPVSSGEPVGIFLAQVHAIRRLASARPAMADRQVFIVGDAEALVPQESSPEAANAFLKLLEEPPDGTIFLLTTSEPDALLPTLRSRLQPIRVRALPEARVAQFLRDELGTPPDRAEVVARLSQGSIGRALGFLPSDDAPGPLDRLRDRARTWLEAAASDRPAARMRAAHAQAPSGARGEFHDVLEFLALWIRDLAAAAAGASEQVVNRDALERLDQLARRMPAATTGAPAALSAVERARALAHGNVNPQLLLAWLLARIRSALIGAPSGASGPS